MLNIGVYADKPYASTGFSVVCNALAREMAKQYAKVYYFGRFGFEEFPATSNVGFASRPSQLTAPFFYVPCIGGVWDEKVVEDSIKHYKIDAVFSEDDWFSANGLANACKKTKKPFHFLTPIDSLPLHINANKIFNMCHTVYTPNSSWQIIKERGYNAVFLPHGVETHVFKSMKKKPATFTFLWIGRDDFRKAFGRAILAVEQLCRMTDEKFVMLAHLDWVTPQAKQTFRYIKMKNLPIICSQSSNMPHATMAKIFNMAHVNLCTAKAGGFEMSITEAAACELPSLVTDWTFMREQIINGKTGWLIPWDNLGVESDWKRIWANISIDGLAERMLWCIGHKETIQEMGRQAREDVSERFNWENAGKELLRRITESVK